MADLKPKLMLSRSGRRRSGGGSIGSIIMFIIVFAVGFYAGGKYNGLDGILGSAEKSIGMNQDERDRVKSVENSLQVPERDIVSENETQDLSAEAESSLTEQSVNDERSVSPAKNDLQVGKFKDLGAPDTSSPDTGRTENQTTLPVNASEGPDAGEQNQNIDAVDADKGEVPGTFTLQVAAFTDEDEAREVAAMYNEKGYDAYSIRLENSRGEIWNLVRIGKYDTNEQAINNAEIFSNREGQRPLIQTYYEGTNIEASN